LAAASAWYIPRVQIRPAALVAMLSVLGACPSPSPTTDAKKGEDSPAAPAKEGPDKKADTKAPAKAGEDSKAPPAKPAPRGQQVPPPSDVAAPPADASRTESGLAFKVLTPGTGTIKPGPDDKVKVAYTGWTTDGVTFDTTEGRQPRTFGLNGVIKGWQEALPRMVAGEKTRFWVPEELAYKGRTHGPQGMLVFDIELVEVIEAPKAPEDVAAPPAGTKKTKGGVAYKVLTAGTGDKHPRAWDRVKVHYTGWTTDGKMFDSSVMKGRPASFELNRVIPGWTEGIPVMVIGEKTRFWIPQELAYAGKPGPQGMLVFDVELLEVEELPEPPPPPKTPKDVAAPPKDAKRTESGLAYKVLTPGKGDKHPDPTSRVKVHYSGWTTDGKMFDSSVTRGQPATFPLSGVIKGWTEGLQLMVPGEKTRFWIPKELAYNDQPGKPAGMLVFDVELLEIL